MNIFLIGMPGAGKSYWANKITLLSEFKLIDLDLEIERKFNSTIPELFLKGEIHFRKIEAEVLKQTLHQIDKKTHNYIISTGGGIVCYEENLTSMKKSGLVVYLHVGISILKDQILKDNKKRPLLPKYEPELSAALESLYVKRKLLYERADFTIDPNQKSFPIFVEELIRKFKTDQHVQTGLK